MAIRMATHFEGHSNPVPHLGLEEEESEILQDDAIVLMPPPAPVIFFFFAPVISCT